MHATPKKLRSGAWGALVTGTPASGSPITITARSGKSWTAIVDRVIWTGTDRGGATISICATSSGDRRSRRRPQWCECGACEDLMSVAGRYSYGQIIRCPECGGRAEVG